MGLRKIMVSEMGLVENMVNMVSRKIMKKSGQNILVGKTLGGHKKSYVADDLRK